jgi:rhodanese-related sulfurtransferase
MANFLNRQPIEIEALLDAGRISLVDVREPDEFAAEHIRGALLMPLSGFHPAALPDHYSRPVILYCGSGKRSGLALQKCADAGVAIMAHMAGGIMAWKQAGLPTVQAK